MSASTPKGLRGLGSYATPAPPREERKPAMVVKYQGERAHVRFHDGSTYTIPSKLMRSIDIPEGGQFTLVTTWQGERPISVRAEVIAQARPIMERKTETPKFLKRDGKKMSTR